MVDLGSINQNATSGTTPTPAKLIPVIPPSKGHGYDLYTDCLLYTSPSPRDRTRSRMPSSA